MTKAKTKVCYVLSYRDPNYVRTRVLLQALESIENVELYVARNSAKGILRYPETLVKTAYIRLRHNPDVYFLGFRGQEIFWPIRLIAFGKKLIFDEFLVMYDWFVNEQKKIKTPFIKRILYAYNKSILKRSDLVLEDTKAGAKFSSDLFKISSAKYKYIHVGTDEAVFKAGDYRISRGSLNVLFYGTMLPLHGVDLILEAAKKLRGKPVKFVIIGSSQNKAVNKKIQSQLDSASLRGVEYKKWVDFGELPEYIAAADLCLGGPFGDTSQSRRVITGKTYQFLAMGKPVVVCDIPGETGFVDKKNVIVSERGSAESIAEAVLWALKNKRELAKIGKEGRELYKRRFSQGMINRQVQNILRSL